MAITRSQNHRLSGPVRRHPTFLSPCGGVRSGGRGRGRGGVRGGARGRGRGGAGPGGPPSDPSSSSGGGPRPPGGPPSSSSNDDPPPPPLGDPPNSSSSSDDDLPPPPPPGSPIYVHVDDFCSIGAWLMMRDYYQVGQQQRSTYLLNKFFYQKFIRVVELSDIPLVQHLIDIGFQGKFVVGSADHHLITALQNLRIPFKIKVPININ